MSTVAELVEQRRTAIDRGDKALGRELYGTLIGLGCRPEDIDAGGDVGPVSADPSPEPVVAQPPSNDPLVVQRWNYRQALEGELGMVSNAKNGNPRRAKEIQEVIDVLDSEIGTLVAQEKEPEAPETTQAPEAPEKAVKPARKRRGAKAK